MLASISGQRGLNGFVLVGEGPGTLEDAVTQRKDGEIHPENNESRALQTWTSRASRAVADD